MDQTQLLALGKNLLLLILPSCYNRQRSAEQAEAAAVSSHNLRIRPALAGDAADLAALARRVFVATYGPAIPAPTLQAYLHDCITTTVFSAQIAAAVSLLVAETDTGLSGYARLHITQPPTCVGDARAIELAQLYVDAAYQQRGLGAQLLTAAAALVDAPIWLCAWERNQRALRFYARHGFTTVGRMAIYVREIVFDDLVLVRQP